MVLEAVVLNQLLWAMFRELVMCSSKYFVETLLQEECSIQWTAVSM